MTNKTEYTVNNFSAVNEFIDEENRYAKHFRKFKIASLFRKYAIYGSLLIVAISLLILSIGIAYWLYNNQPAQLIKISSSSVTQINNEDELKELKKLAEDNKIDDLDQIQKIDQEYVIFKIQSFILENEDFAEVHTGWRYKPDDLNYPYLQYCYLSIPSKPNSSISMTIQLAKKMKFEDIVDAQYNENEINYFDFESAKSQCIFKY
tara:strand:+ start:77 stop:694 length:618 start_codon:yes stop_codon:yes gene_type:complete